MIEKRSREGMCQLTHRYAKANKKYTKNYDKKMESPYLTYLDANVPKIICKWFYVV